MIPATRFEVFLQIGVLEVISVACEWLVPSDAELSIREVLRLEFAVGVFARARIGDDIPIRVAAHSTR